MQKDPSPIGRGKPRRPTVTEYEDDGQGADEYDEDRQGNHTRVISRRISVKDDGMTSRSEDGGYAGRGIHGGHLGASEDDEDDVRNEGRDYVDD